MTTNCSFCGRSSNSADVTTIISADGGHTICDLCVDVAANICGERRRKLADERYERAWRERLEREAWARAEGP